MNSEKLLRSIGNVNDCYIEEAETNVTHNKGWKKSLITMAACLTICIIFGSGIVVTKNMGLDIKNLFRIREDNYYIQAVNNDIFTGEITEVHEEIKKQFEKYNPVMSWNPSVYYKSFETIKDATTYIGVDFIENPVGENEKNVSVTISGNKEGDFHNVQLTSKHKIDNYEITINNIIYTDIFVKKKDKIIFGSSADEKYEEFSKCKGEEYITKSGTKTLIVQSKTMDDNQLSLEGFFTKGKVLYTVQILVEKSKLDEGVSVLKKVLKKY